MPTHIATKSVFSVRLKEAFSAVMYMFPKATLNSVSATVNAKRGGLKVVLSPKLCLCSWVCFLSMCSHEITIPSILAVRPINTSMSL